MNEINEKLFALKNDSELQLKRIADLENTDHVHGSDIKTLFDTSSRYLQHIQELEILNDKVSNMDGYHTRSENKMKVELIESISKNSETLKTFCQRTIEKSEQKLSENVSNLRKTQKSSLKRLLLLKTSPWLRKRRPA